MLLCSGGEIDKARFGMSWIGEAHAIPIMEQRDLVDGFVKNILGPILKARGLDQGRLGVDQANISFIEAMREHLPDLELFDGDTIMQQARWIKSDGEIAIIEEACAIGDSVTQRALDETKAGRRELEVAGDAMQTLFYLGGEMAHVITPFVASGEHMSPPHRLATDKIIRNQDLCFIDIGAMWNGYFADIGRTTIVGKPHKRQQEIYTAVYEGLMAGIDKMRPGFTNKDCSDAIIAKIGEHDLAENLFSLFIGHGIGMGANEPPYIGETLPGAPTYEFQPNMVFAVEPLVWVPNTSRRRRGSHRRHGSHHRRSGSHPFAGRVRRPPSALIRPSGHADLIWHWGRLKNRRPPAQMMRNHADDCTDYVVCRIHIREEER